MYCKGLGRGVVLGILGRNFGSEFWVSGSDAFEQEHTEKAEVGAKLSLISPFPFVK
jgi:hypothetical protein